MAEPELLLILRALLICPEVECVECVSHSCLSETAGMVIAPRSEQMWGENPLMNNGYDHSMSILFSVRPGFLSFSCLDFQLYAVAPTKEGIFSLMFAPVEENIPILN